MSCATRGTRGTTRTFNALLFATLAEKPKCVFVENALIDMDASTNYWRCKMSFLQSSANVMVSPMFESTSLYNGN